MFLPSVVISGVCDMIASGIPFICTFISKFNTACVVTPFIEVLMQRDEQIIRIENAQIWKYHRMSTLRLGKGASPATGAPVGPSLPPSCKHSDFLFLSFSYTYFLNELKFGEAFDIP